MELVYSQTRKNSIILDLFFKVSGNIDKALNDPTASFDRGRSCLPDDIESTRILKFEPSA